MEPELMEFRKNILLWYPFKNNCSILNLGKSIDDYINDLNIKIDKFDNYNDISYGNNNNKYDYIIITGDFSISDEFCYKLEIANSFLKKDGKILIAINNRLGLTNLNENGNIYKNVSKKEIELSIEKYGFKNEKFYYVFPNYENANLIYSEDYELSNEDISRNFFVYDKNATISFNENDVYRALLEQGKDYVNTFANSFFIEVSNSKIDTDVKYVSYSNYRKSKYRTMTIVSSKNVLKKATSEDSKEHILEMKKNIEDLKQKGIKVLEEFDGEKFVSKFIKGKRFDTELLETNTIKEFKNKFEILKRVLENSLVSYDELISELDEKSRDIKECIKNYDSNKLKKLRFLRKAYLDFLPKNCFIIHGKLHVFDQEWVDYNIPVEFIYYRMIMNTPNLVNKFGLDILLNEFGIYEHLGLFQELDFEFTESVFDEKVHRIYFRQYSNIKDVAYKEKLYQNRADSLEKEIENLTEENRLLNLELEDARGKLVNYANELRFVGNTWGWKLLLKAKSIRRIINPFNGLSLIERLYPTGSKRRENYEKNKIVKNFNKWKSSLKNLTDKTTYDYWLELEKRFIARRKEIEESPKDAYELWIRSNGMTLEKMQFQREDAKKFEINPKISIIIPLYNTPVDLFRELLFTVECQTYSNWELCLADGSCEELTEIKNMCLKDSRIKYKFIGENKGISGNTNEALKLVTGDYIALLDHDDLLTFNSLFEIVKCINNNRDVEFIYTDEDKIENIDSPRYDPDFKPDYSPDTLRSGNYITHFSIFKKELMDKLGGFRSKCDGAQDFDIILRATELAGYEKIRHIPNVLYHWRIHEGSTAGNSDAKLYAYESGTKAVQDHLDRLGLKAKAKMNEKYRGYYEVDYELTDTPKVNILIVNKKNDFGLLAKCVEYILENTSYSNYEIDILDSGSEETGTIRYYNEISNNKNVKVYKYDDGYSYSKLINETVNKIDGEYFVEFDRFERPVTSNWIERMLEFATREDVGAVGGKTYYTDGSIKSAGMVYGIGDYAIYLYRNTSVGYKMRDKIVCNTSIVSGLFRMTKTKAFKKVLGMNENIDFELINEVDFSFRLLDAGYKNLYIPYAEFQEIIRSDEREEVPKERLYDYKKQIKALKQNWKKYFDTYDPYYNVNFNRELNSFAIYTGEVKY